nr:hypothetical protein [Tanacetum cinerariifolium]
EMKRGFEKYRLIGLHVVFPAAAVSGDRKKFSGGGAWHRWVVDLVDRDARNHFGVRRKTFPATAVGRRWWWPACGWRGGRERVMDEDEEENMSSKKMRTNGLLIEEVVGEAFNIKEEVSPKYNATIVTNMVIMPMSILAQDKWKKRPILW